MPLFGLAVDYISASVFGEPAPLVTNMCVDTREILPMNLPMPSLPSVHITLGLLILAFDGRSGLSMTGRRLIGCPMFAGACDTLTSCHGHSKVS